jgi:hypothetical protein
MSLNKIVSGAAKLASTTSSSIGSGITAAKAGASSALGSLENKVAGLSAAGSLKSLGALVRSRNIKDAISGLIGSTVTSAVFEGAVKDWRVRLSIPESLVAYNDSYLISPLTETNGFVFPYTPQISIAHSANYQSVEPVHNNYPFFAYQNSKVEAITITGQFFLEDSNEARYWVGAVHYLRSVTKMSYGETSNAGAPPPVVHLNGYGDFVFKDVPVVVTSFQIELPNDVDYISTGLGDSNLGPVDPGLGVAWAPVKNTITVTVQPIYSREEVRQFSLDAFVRGDYVKTSGKYI